MPPEQTNASQPTKAAAPAAAPAPNTVHPTRTEQPQQQLVVSDNHFRDGRITRAGMLAAIKNGGSVIYHETEPMRDDDGKPIKERGKQVMRVVRQHHITKIEDVPPESSLAETPEEKQSAREQLERDRQRIDQQLADLGDKPAAAVKK